LTFRWDTCDAKAASWSNGDPEYDVPGQLDVENILEWQTVTGFFDWLNKKIMDGGWVPTDPTKTLAKTF
jgi:hypothetical protein